jgi:hypothetical protein
MRIRTRMLLLLGAVAMVIAACTPPPSGADTKPPALTLPGDITAAATTPAGGATVVFDVYAIDQVDGPVAATCTPPSGTEFPMGATTVSCEATDTAGNTGQGSFIVNVIDGTVGTPPNDAFASAQTLSFAGTNSTHGTTDGATIQTGEPDHAGYSADQTVWYRFTAPATATTYFSAYSGEYLSGALAVYQGASLASLTPVASTSSEQPYCVDQGFPPIRLSATAGTTYFLAVATRHADFNPGGFDLFWSVGGPPPANDRFADAQPVTFAGNGALAGTSVDSTIEQGEQSYCEGTVWYRFIPTVSGTLGLSTNGFGPTGPYDGPPLTALYRGASIGALTNLGSTADDTGSFWAHVEAGVTYHVSVGPHFSKFDGVVPGPFVLSWDFTPDPNLLGEVSTFAGTSGTRGSTDGIGAAARFNNPYGVAVDSADNIYVADWTNLTIRKVTPAGVVTTFAGSAGSPGSNDGTGPFARFRYPAAVAVDSADNVYVADWGNSTIRKITPAGVVTTLAGTALSQGSADGTGVAARFRGPTGLAVDSADNIYVADSSNSTIRRVTPAGVVTTLAGTAGVNGADDGIGAAARFNDPHGVAVDSDDNIFVTDSDSQTIRKVTPWGAVTTLAGTALAAGSDDGIGAAARFNAPQGLAVDSADNLYVADNNNETIRRVTPTGAVTTVAGTAGVYGAADGIGPAARFNTPVAVAVDSADHLYVADYWNHTIRKII